MSRTAMHSLTFAAAATSLLLIGAPAFASDSDSKIDSSFKKTYVAMTYLKNDSVKAESKNGVVTLTGTVADPSRKALAQETALGLPGVTRVDNQLVTTAQVNADNMDNWIDRKLRLTLLFHRNVNAATTVEVKEGVVTLKGEASSLAQKELTTEYASDIDGVREVKNEMTVAAKAKTPARTVGEKLDDASISAQVRAALSTHRSSSNVQTKVQTRNGEVTITGIARNGAEKDMVTKLVADIQGVTSTKNQMTITESKKQMTVTESKIR